MTQTEQMVALKARGHSYREIGGKFGLTGQAVWWRLRGHEVASLPLFEIDSAAALKTYFAQTQRLHLHAISTKGRNWAWQLVHRKTAKCGTRRCLKVAAG